MLKKYSSPKKTLWINLIPLSAFLLYDFFQINLLNSVAPFAMELVKITPTQLGIISSMFFLVNLIFLFPAGALLDSKQPKWLMAISLLITVIGIGIFTIKPNITTMVIWRSLSGITGAFSYLSCVKMLADGFSRRHLGLLIGLTGIVIMMAGVIAQYPLIWVLNSIGLVNTMLLNGGVGILVIILILFITKNNDEDFTNAFHARSKMSAVFLKKFNWLIALYACLTNFPLFVLGALWGNLYLQHEHHMTLEAASFVSSMIFIGNIFGAPLLGSIGDKLKNKKLLMVISASIMLISTYLILISPMNTSYLYILTLFFVLGFSTGSQTLAYASVVEINEQHNTAKATSMLSFLSVGGCAIAQPLFGFIVALGNGRNYQNGMYLLVASAMIAIALSYYYFVVREKVEVVAEPSISF